MTDFQALEAIRPILNAIMREKKINSTEAIGELIVKVTGSDHELLAKVFAYALAEVKTNNQVRT